MITRWMMPAAVSQTDIKIEMSWASLRRKNVKLTCELEKVMMDWGIIITSASTNQARLYISFLLSILSSKISPISYLFNFSFSNHDFTNKIVLKVCLNRQSRQVVGKVMNICYIHLSRVYVILHPASLCLSLISTSLTWCLCWSWECRLNMTQRESTWFNST